MTRGRAAQDKSASNFLSGDASLTELSEDGRNIVMAIRNDIDKLRKECLEQMNEKNLQINSLNEEVTALKEKVSKLEEKIDEAEAYERRDALVFSGEDIPPVEPGENCTSIVCNLMKRRLNLNVNPSDISTSHRLGRKPTTQRSDKRKIITKLCRRDLKGDILGACRSAKPNFYVNESLTPLRSTIMYVLRQAKKKNNRLVGCKSIGGRVFAWITPPDGQGERHQRIPINTHLELQSFCCDILQEPLTAYVQRWPY